MSELKVYDTDPTIYLFTSLTAGSSHIITATSRIETILKANKVPFKYKDTATDELAKKLFQRRASGKKLPLIVKEGYVLGGIEEIEEWNEYDELREALGFTAAFTPLPAKPSAPTSAAPPSSSAAAKKEDVPKSSAEQNLAIRQMGAEAAQIAAAKKQAPVKISTTNPLLAEKVNTRTTTATPAKSPAKADPSSILSPRSVPLPQTPTPASSTTKTGKTEPAKKIKLEPAKKGKVESVKKSKVEPVKKGKVESVKKGKVESVKKGKVESVKKGKVESAKKGKVEPAKKSKSEPAKPNIPKLSDLQKGVHAPPSIHADAANPALNAGPISETQKAQGSGSESKESVQKELRGAKVSDASKEEIKKVEQATAIPEESSEEEDDDEDDEDDEESDDKSSEEEDSDEEEESDGEEVTTVKKESPEAKETVETKKESSEEESSEEESSEDDSSEEESSEEESSEEEKEGKAKEVAKAPKQDPKGASKVIKSVKG